MLAVGAGASVLLQGGQILTVNGAMTLASGDTLTLSTNYPGNTQVVVNGTLTATTTTFNLAGNGYGGDVLTVNSGGRLVASGSTFALNQVTLNAGSVFNPGDLSGDTFNGPLYLPITDVPLLSAAGGGSDNKSFQDIDILAGTLGTGTVNLNAIGTVSTASLRYVFPGNFTVAAGATLNVGPTVPVLLQGGQILTVNGAMTLASGDTLTLSTNYPGNTQVVVNGTLTATTTTFNLAGNGYGGDVLTVNSGGRLVASGSTFALNQVTLNAGSVFNPGDLSGDTFNGPLYLPITDVPLLSAAGGGSDNKSFQDIDILAGTLGTGTVNLNAIGTVSTASLRYVFPGNFTVAAGATLNVGPTVPVLLQGGQILTVNGAMTLASGDTLTLSTNYPGNTQVVVNGTLTATTTTFNLAGNGYGGDVLTVNSGGRLVASGSTFALNQVTLNAGSVFNPGDLSGDTFNGPLYLPITDVPLLSAAGGGSDNKSFQDIDILAGTLGTGTVNLNAIGTVSTASLRYVFPGNFTVAAGATLNVGPTVPVLLQGGQILTVNGAMTLASGDTLTLSTNYPGNTQVVVNGTLTATTTTFNLAGNGYGGDVLTVNSGGRLVASGSTFALNQVTLNAGSVFNPGDLSGDTFNGPLYLPITDVPLLSAAGGGSDNKSFQDIDILAGTLGTGTVNLNAIGTVSTASLRYVFPGNFTVAAGATLNVGPTVPVLLQGGQILTVNGAMTLASGDTLTLSTNYPGNTQVVVNGTLTATTTTFNLAGNGYGGDVLTVNSGGRLVASGSTFALNQVTLNAGSVFNPGDLSGDTFNGPLYLPITDVPLLSAAGGGSDNKSFQDIDILAGTLGTGTVNLNAIGTVSTASLRYVFPGNFTVAAGATLNVGPTVPVLLQGGQILTVNGAMTLASGDTLTLSTNYPGNTQVVVNGTLTATTTTFNLAGNGYGGDVLTVNSGGRLVASGSTFALNQVTLASGSTDTLITDIISGVFAINSGAALNIAEDDFSTVGSNGIVATGNPNSTINLVNNYWGTTDPSSIAAKILDHLKDSTRPIVSYNPFLGLKPVATTSANVAVLYNTALQNVTLTAKVTSAYGIVNEGNVTFTISNGSTTIGNPVTVGVSGGTVAATYLLPAGTPGGTYTIQAVYGGSANYTSLPDISHFLTIGSDATITTGSNAASTYSLATQTVSLNASVTSSGIAVNAGTVTFSILNGNIVLGNPVTANVSGGSVSVGYILPAGTVPATYTIQATYNGTPNFGTSSDGSHTLIVSPAATTTAAANVSVPYNTASQVVSLSATVASPAGTVNEGTETFTILSGGTTLGSPVTANVSGGSAIASYTLPAGTVPASYTIRAVYSGTSNFLGITDSSHFLTVNPPPTASVSVTIDPASDSGASNLDGLTNVKTPTFDVQVNQAGTIGIDFNGDGTIDATLPVSAAGTYQLISSALSDGKHTAKVNFQPTTGQATQATTAFTIDTVGGHATAFSPSGTIKISASQATVTFSEPMDLGTFIPSAITFTGPGGTIAVGQPQLVSGSTYTIPFPVQAASGTYTLTIAPTVADLAGNKLDQNHNGINGESSDSFTGTFTENLPVGGPITLNTPTVGFLPASKVDDWTFFGRAGQTITTVVTTSASTSVLPPPDVYYAQISLVDSSGNVVGTASNSASGAVATLADITLPDDGVYHVRISAPAGHPGATGFYNLLVADATVHQMPLIVNTDETGQLLDTYSKDQWTFATTANQRVKFDKIVTANSDIEFDLTGPNGYTAFVNATSSSGQIDLPYTGTYTLTVHTVGQPGAYGFELEQASQIALPLNTPFAMPLAGSGQSQLYSVTIGANNPLELKLTDANAGDQNEIYVSYGKLPTRNTFDYKFTGGPAANETVVLTAKPGTYYVLVYDPVVKAAGSYTIEADSNPFLLNGVTPGTVGNGFDSTLQFAGVFPLTTGNGGYVLSTAPTAQLIKSDGTVVPGVTLTLKPPPFGTVGGQAGGVNPDGTMIVTAVLPGGLVLPGTYSVRVNDKNGYSQTLANALTVVQGGQGILKTNVIVPNPIGYHVAATIYVQYTNVGNAPLQAPLLVLDATQNGKEGALLTLDPSKIVSGFWTSATPDGYSQSVQILASGAVPGILQPGESESIPVYYAGWLRDQWDFSRPPINFTLGVLDTTNTDPTNWASLKDSLRPASISPTAWNALYPNLAAQLGPTFGAYVQKLDADAQYLGGLGENVTDIGQLFNFEVQQAVGYSPLSTLASATDAQVASPGLPLSFSRTFTPGIIARNQFGRFGWGWSDSWSTSFTVDSDGSVNVAGPNGSLRRFQPDSRGGYFAQAGDHGTLAARTGGSYTLTELDGQITAYNADGTLSYVQDPNGNRITASYSNGLLTRLTHSSGQYLALAYNAAGLVASITDSVGRRTTYGYDPTNQYLTSVTTFDGQTTGYTYDTGTVAATAHALRSVTHSDGSHDYFSYDTRGRLADAHRDGGVDDASFAYDEGQVRVADVLGDTTTYSFDHRGLLVQVQNPLGNTVHYNYDGNFNLVQTTDAAGQVYTNTYDSYGDVLSTTDPLGHTVHYTYECNNDRLAAVTDANGNTTAYGYDGKGNLTSTTYADNTVASVAYDPIGNVLKSVDQMGQATTYTRDAAGNIFTETFADGTKSAFTYDSRENLTSAIDASGTTILTYDANDSLIQITYPSGLYLKFSYDAAGRRTRMVDQTGFTVNYSYDAVGNLTTLTDGGGNLIVRYTFNLLGQLAREDHGNGTYVLYDYDPAGQLLDVVNYAPDGTVNARYHDTFNNLGQLIARVSLDGTWTYTYDAVGELTHAVYASTNSLIPDQDLSYAYDAAGNRTQTITNGVVTTYTMNALNQYTQVGSTHYAYNPVGNLISSSDPTGTTSYSYNARNQRTGQSGPNGSWAYRYDVFGNRNGVTHDGQTTNYLYDASGFDGMVSSYDGSGNQTATYTYGDGSGPVNQTITGGSTSYYLYCSSGNTMGLTNSSGFEFQSYLYDPFGNLLGFLGNLSNPFTFGSQFNFLNNGDGGYYSSIGDINPQTASITSEDNSGFDNTIAEFFDKYGNYIAYGLKALSILSGKPVLETPGAVNDGFGIFTDAYYITNGKPFKGGVDYALDVAAGVVAFNAGEAAKYASGLLKEAKEAEQLAEYFLGRANLAEDAIEAANFLRTSSDLTRKATGLFELAGSNAVRFAFGRLAVIGLGVIATKILFDYVYEHSKLALIDSCTSVNSVDPNDKFGPTGYSNQAFVSPANPLSYRVDFENDPTASAPAQRVDVTDQLDPNLDWSTFQWTGVGFGDTTILIPANTQHYQTILPMTYDGVTFRVVVTLDLNPLTGMVHASFQSLNATNLMTGLADCPGTLPLGPSNPFADLPPSALIGFLPPEDGTGRGMGNLTYSVRARAGLATGTQLRNVANVTFDLGNTIATDQVSETDPSLGRDPAKQALVTIDSGLPTSSVAALPAYFATPTFTVSWSGSDETNGSGIGSYTIYVSDNGGSFKPWLIATMATSATYSGVDGHTYRFFSLATDNAGNLQPVPTSAQATTIVDATDPTSTVAALPAFSRGTFTLTWSGGNPNGLGIASYDVYVSDNGGVFTPVLTGTSLTSTSFTGTNNHTYAFYSVATDAAGRRQPTPTSAQATTKVDSVAPTSSVLALPATSLPTFTVSWSGIDAPGGSGLASYDIYVSDNNAPFTRWLAATTATSAPYTGANGHTYRFFSVARDNVGNVEPTPTSAQATTLVSTNLSFQVTSSIAHPVYGQSQSFEANLAPIGSGLPTPTGTVQFLVDGTTFGSPVTLVNGIADRPGVSTLAAGPHVITVSYSGDGTYSAQNSTLSETIARATLLVTADPKAKLYGAAVPALTYSITGYVNGETATAAGITGTPSLTTPATAASPVGSYAIHVDIADLAAANYTFAGQDGTLTVNPAVLTVTANNVDMDHYDAVPNLTYTISGFVNGDPSSVVTGSPNLGTSATSTSFAGFYPITVAPGSLASQNYTFAVVPGTLTVHPKVMDVRVAYGSKSMSLIGLTRDLPFFNITAIDVIFSDDVTVASGDLGLTGVNLSSYGFNKFSYNAASHDATWTLPSALDIDRLMMALDGTTPVGVHTPGTLINLRNNLGLGFAVLPGDVNGDGVVNSQDQVLVRNQMQGTGDPILIPWVDVDGNGIVDINDFNLVKKKAGTHLP